MNKPIMTVFALLLSIATVAEEGPSKEDTIAWLFEKIRRIEIPEYDVPDTDYEYNIYEIVFNIDFPEDGATIEIHSRQKRTYKFAVKYDARKVYSRYNYTVSAKLSDLSSHVEISTAEPYPTKDYMDIVLSCSSKECFKGSSEDLWNGDYEERKRSWSSVTVMIPTTIAGRVQKALSHLITLSGGKENVPEDLF